MFRASCTRSLAVVVTFFVSASLCIKYDPDQVLWNLNQNQTATDVMDYWGQWENHSKDNVPLQAVLLLNLASIYSLPRQLEVPLLHYHA